MRVEYADHTIWRHWLLLLLWLLFLYALFKVRAGYLERAILRHWLLLLSLLLLLQQDTPFKVRARTHNRGNPDNGPWCEQDTLIAQFCVIGCCYCSSCCCSKILQLRCEPVAIIGVISIMAPGASKMHWSQRFSDRLGRCCSELGLIYVSEQLPTYPSPKPTSTLTSHLGQNFGLREG